MLDELKEELKTLGVQNPEVKEDWIATPEGVEEFEADPNDSADRVEDWDERRATLSLFETRYNNVVRALAKIKSGTYGKCEFCEKDIEEKRLSVNPAARTCLQHINNEADLSN